MGHPREVHWGLGIGGSPPSPERLSHTADDLVPLVPEQSLNVGKGAPVALKKEDGGGEGEGTYDAENITVLEGLEPVRKLSLIHI